LECREADRWKLKKIFSLYKMDKKVLVLVAIVVAVAVIIVALYKGSSLKLSRRVVAPKTKASSQDFLITKALQSISGQNLNIFPLQSNKPPKVVKIVSVSAGSVANGVQTSTVTVSDGEEFTGTTGTTGATTVSLSLVDNGLKAKLGEAELSGFKSLQNGFVLRFKEPPLEKGQKPRSAIGSNLSLESIESTL
jgi:hypothetical protein